jgi:hypothetical protein
VIDTPEPPEVAVVLVKAVEDCFKFIAVSSSKPKTDPNLPPFSPDPSP